MDQTYKYDSGKLQYRLIPPAALRRVAEALTYGASKYNAHTWVHVGSQRYLDATMRHIEAFRLGDRFDEESGLPHLAMAITNLMFLVERQEHDNEEMGKEALTYYEEIDEEAHKGF